MPRADDLAARLRMLLGGAGSAGAGGGPNAAMLAALSQSGGPPSPGGGAYTPPMPGDDEVPNPMYDDASMNASQGFRDMREPVVLTGGQRQIPTESRGSFGRPSAGPSTEDELDMVQQGMTDIPWQGEDTPTDEDLDRVEEDPSQIDSFVNQFGEEQLPPGLKQSTGPSAKPIPPTEELPEELEDSGR